MKKINNEELTKIIESILANEDKELAETIFEIVTKINELRRWKKASIAKLINYDPKNNPNTKLVDPLTQGKVNRYVNQVCEKIGIKIKKVDDSVRGLAYFTEFKK